MRMVRLFKVVICFVGWCLEKWTQKLLAEARLSQSLVDFSATKIWVGSEQPYIFRRKIYEFQHSHRDMTKCVSGLCGWVCVFVFVYLCVVSLRPGKFEHSWALIVSPLSLFLSRVFFRLHIWIRSAVEFSGRPKKKKRPFGVAVMVWLCAYAYEMLWTGCTNAFAFDLRSSGTRLFEIRLKRVLNCVFCAEKSPNSLFAGRSNFLLRYTMSSSLAAQHQQHACTTIR